MAYRLSKGKKKPPEVIAPEVIVQEACMLKSLSHSVSIGLCGHCYTNVKVIALTAANSKH